ncbi:hypothetical protein Tco_0826601 [Tanacetum coccineum]
MAASDKGCIREELRGCDDPMLKLIDIPAMLHLERRLLESRGCLLLVCRDDIGSREFTIYEMMKGCSVWTEDTGDANVGKVLVRKANFDVACRDLEAAFEYSVLRLLYGLTVSTPCDIVWIRYACSNSLLLTPLCCDNIHDVTPRVSALAGCDILWDIEAGNHEELLSGMTNNMREAAMDALVLLWLKNLNIDESLIVQSVSIQDKPGSYIAAAGGSRPKPSATVRSKLDPSISKAKFCSLFSKNLCEGVYVSIPRKVVEMVFSEDGLSIIASQIDVLKESLTIGVHLIEDIGFKIKTVLIPITVVTLVVPAPIVEMTNDGFQTVGKKKKGKSKSINGGQIGGHFVKQNVRYEPKATTINQYVLPLSNVGLR